LSRSRGYVWLIGRMRLQSLLCERNEGRFDQHSSRCRRLMSGSSCSQASVRPTLTWSARTEGGGDSRQGFDATVPVGSGGWGGVVGGGVCGGGPGRGVVASTGGVSDDRVCRKRGQRHGVED